MRRTPAPRACTPWIVVLGGPNGAGKTTSALSLLPAELKVGHFVNADMIARGLSPFDPDATAMQAGRLLLASTTAQDSPGQLGILERSGLPI